MELCGFNEIPSLVGTPAVATTPTPSASPSASATAAASPPPPPYATGICSFHLQEWQDCADDSKNLFAIVNMLDNNKNSIGDTPTGPGSPLGAPINAARSNSSAEHEPRYSYHFFCPCKAFKGFRGIAKSIIGLWATCARVVLPFRRDP